LKGKPVQDRRFRSAGPAGGSAKEKRTCLGIGPKKNPFCRRNILLFPRKYKFARYQYEIKAIQRMKRLFFAGFRKICFNINIFEK
jgi:hypothetical protein